MLPPQLLHPVRLGREDTDVVVDDGVAENVVVVDDPCAVGAGARVFGTADLAALRRR